ncbi:MAG: valine--tRNA ligase [Bacteroidia bacterium]
MEIAKTYLPEAVENKWYTYWKTNGYFKADAHSPKPKYSIVIPPPNVTGVLHMGHMLNNTIQDVLIRHARMNSFEACWVPGTDHASIATEAKVVELLKSKGLDKKEIGREKFLEYAFEWKDKYGGIILQQLERLGCSCDWDRTRFTMEEKLSEAVIDAFIHLHKEGMIYRGERMVNWDPVGLTALSDEEVIPEEKTLRLYYINYPLVEDPTRYVTIATSRPETIMADVAICVHPDDERYVHLHGKKVYIPLIQREIPIIPDEYVSIDFGTGCLKVTPAHDKNDFELGKKHGLDIINILNENATLNENALIYVGQDRFMARKGIAKELEEKGHLLKVEDYASQLNLSERTKAVVEPRISMQWFVDMKKFMERNPQVLDSVMNDEIALVPPKFKNTYRHWIENIKDWCISRQLWWGQRIPAWYAPDGTYVVAKTPEAAIEAFSKHGTEVGLKEIRQDEDVVDTWFSSWLWPISVFDGFADPDNADIKAFYPTSTLVTGPDIIFFWVARMVMAGYEFRNQKPFDAVYFTGIVRDKQGRKMSKSLGNSPDALELMDRYGTDGVRMGILLAAPAGNDLLFDESKVEQGRNFCNKIWNALRLVKGWEQSEEAGKDRLDDDRLAGEWFDARMDEVITQLAGNFKEFKLSEGLMNLYKLVWDDFCSQYLEMVKPPFGEAISKSTYHATVERFTSLMALWHPFMPFITEEIYHQLLEDQVKLPLIVTPYPSIKGIKAPLSERFLEIVTQVRSFRNQKGISPKQTLDIGILCSDTMSRKEYEQTLGLMRKLANIGEIRFVTEKAGQANSFLIGTDELFILMEEEVDVEAETERIEKELHYLKGFLQAVDSKLANEKFVANAKADLVEKERQKKADAEQKIRSLEERLSSLV